MTTPTKVHCFFEQSGTFKNEFRKLGIPAEDYDIQNNFGETDHVIDLFAEIERGYDGKPSVFDSIGAGDLIMAFFPCIAFCGVSQIWFSANCKDYRGWQNKRMFKYMLEKENERHEMFSRLYKLVCVCNENFLKLVIENPWSMNTFLKTTVFIKRPDVVDMDRSRRGDVRIKPTAYWFFNCEPTRCYTCEQTDVSAILNHNDTQDGARRGICSSLRSAIHTDYARNFIADFILGRPLGGRPQQQDLFAEV